MNGITITKVMVVGIFQILLISGQCNSKWLKRMIPWISRCSSVQWNDLLGVGMPRFGDVDGMSKESKK